MPSEFYVLGAHAGRAGASNAKKAIHAALDMEAVSLLAGKALKLYQAQLQEFYVTRTNFEVGYWDGWMDRAEELRKT